MKRLRCDIGSMKVLRQISWCFVCLQYTVAVREGIRRSLVGFITSLILRRNNLNLLSMLTERWVNLSIRNDTWKSGVSRSYVTFVDSKEDDISLAVQPKPVCVLPYQRTYENPAILFGFMMHPCSPPAGLGSLYFTWRIIAMYQNV